MLMIIIKKMKKQIDKKKNKHKNKLINTHKK